MSQLSCGTFQSISGRNLFLKLPEFYPKISHNSHWLKLSEKSAWPLMGHALLNFDLCFTLLQKLWVFTAGKREGVHLKKIYVCQFRKILSFRRVFQQNLTTMDQYRTNRTAIIVMQGCPLVSWGWGFSPATMSVSSGNSYRKQKENRTERTS